MAGNRLARMGRYGDTEIRNVSGRQSHVNRREAGLIDLYGMLGESLVKREGAGTINPSSGLPEYHFKLGGGHMYNHANYGSHTNFPGSSGRKYRKEADRKAAEEREQKQREAFGDVALEGFDRNEYMQAMQQDATSGTDFAVSEYLTNLGLPPSDVKYFQTNLNLDYLGTGGFIQKKFERGTEVAGTQYGRSLYDVREQSEAMISPSKAKKSFSLI
jgi:hypothetical protein